MQFNASERDHLFVVAPRIRHRRHVVPVVGGCISDEVGGVKCQSLDVELGAQVRLRDYAGVRHAEDRYPRVIELREQAGPPVLFLGPQRLSTSGTQIRNISADTLLNGAEIWLWPAPKKPSLGDSTTPVTRKQNARFPRVSSCTGYTPPSTHDSRHKSRPTTHPTAKPMTYRKKRSDTRMAVIQKTYGIDFHVRADTKLGNLLRKRRFSTLSKLRVASAGHATRIAEGRRVFVSFHAKDLKKVQGLKLMLQNPRLAFDFYDESVQTPVDSENSSYVRSVIKRKIRSADVLLCLVGNATAWRDWIEWEIRTAASLRKGICAVRLKNSRGPLPPVLRELNVKARKWGLGSLVAAVEQAAANRS